MKTRLLYYDSYLSEEFFIHEFLSGLKEEVRHLGEILNLRRLNEVFNYTYKFKLSMKGQQKRYKDFGKTQQFFKYTPDKKKLLKGGNEVNSPTNIELVPYK
jgi:hypothetical protein